MWFCKCLDALALVLDNLWNWVKVPAKSRVSSVSGLLALDSMLIMLGELGPRSWLELWPIDYATMPTGRNSSTSEMMMMMNT